MVEIFIHVLLQIAMMIMMPVNACLNYVYVGLGLCLATARIRFPSLTDSQANYVLKDVRNL